MNNIDPTEEIAKAAGRRGFMRSATLAGAAGAAALLTVGSIPAEGQSPSFLTPFLPILPKTRSQAHNNFMDIRRHENDHVAFLVSALGANARPKPTFQNLVQPSFQSFVQVSQALENTGVGAYLGAAPVILSRAYLAAAGSIALIEGRHAGWLNSFVDVPITTNVDGVEQSFETPLTAAQVVTHAGPFIASLNGGPPVTYDTTPSNPNDIQILNFALALEYLEAEFYNLNAPLFS